MTAHPGRAGSDSLTPFTAAPGPAAPRDPETLNPAWRFAGHGPLANNQPLVAAGDRILGVAGGTVFSVDIVRGGEPKPDDQVKAPGFPYQLRATDGSDPHLVAAGGLVYFMDGTNLVALRLSDGQPLENWAPPALTQVSGLLATDDKVVAVHVGDDGSAQVTGFTAVSGKPSFGPVTISDVTPGSVAYGQHAVFFVASDRLRAVNVDFGDDRWLDRKQGKNIPTGGFADEPLSPSSAPCIIGGVVLAAGSALHAFDVAKGRHLWKRAAGGANAAWSTPVASDDGTLAIAANSSGEVVALRLTDGSLAWRVELATPGAPAAILGRVALTSDGGSVLTCLGMRTGEVTGCYTLPDRSAQQPPVVTNDTVFVPDAFGAISARPFARQDAAYFDGVGSRIDITADGAQFDFGTGDFTIEAWVRSSEGGEVISSHPTDGDTNAHGFRLNISRRGQIRYALFNLARHSLVVGRTSATNVTDGEWHHVALMRRGGAMLVLLDGVSHKLFFLNDKSAGALSIGGQSALTIGAHVESAKKKPEAHFRGLLRELRVWDRALDIATVATNLNVELTGREPRLKGLWGLDEVHAPGKELEPKNRVARHRAGATFVGAASAVTDLVMDRSAFPYLLHEPERQWPYIGVWGARGEKPVTTAAALSPAGPLAFGTNNAIYAVNGAEGHRRWSVDVGTTASAPCADGSQFYVLTADESLTSIDALSGEAKQVKSFAGLLDGHAGPLAAPVATSRYLAAGSPSGKVYLLDRTTEGGAVLKADVAAPVRRLSIGKQELYVVCGADGALQIAVIDLATGAGRGTVAVTSDALCAAGPWLVCVVGGDVVRIDPANPRGTPAFRADVAGSVTGLAASVDAKLVVVCTADGGVRGLALDDLTPRWSTTLPGGGVVHQPVIDLAARVYCTSRAATVAVIDGNTGARVGLYTTPQPVVTPPALNAGTLYYGCADPTAEDADVDGALHSLVLGETMVLRLGLDERGRPVSSAPHVVVDAEVEKSTLHLMNVKESCVEAWINVPAAVAGDARQPGGGILGICPSDASAFDMNLSVDADGTLHYTARSKDAKAWTGVHASVKTTLCDGTWHHVAVARSRKNGVLVYVDGHALPKASVTQETVADPPTKMVTGVKAFIGATAGGDLGAAQPFCGLIAEVRVWDTYLESREISDRRHVKLRGNEPDLLAYWNFNHQNAVDGARNGHDGVVTDAGTEPVWWLTDLAFEQPTYPFLTTAAAIAHEAADQTTYKLTVKVCAADQSGQPDQRVDVWYVRQRDDEPKEITINGTPIGDAVKVFTTTTVSDGTVSLLVGSPGKDHGPALDLRAPFMDEHERFHVSVLLDKQTLAPPTPPTLVVQTRLMQDYSYTTGSKIDETRDRSTWRTVLRAVEPDQTIRPGEPITLWAAEHVDVESAGVRYALNPENGSELATNDHGELVIVSDATELSAVTLYARAGFMHRDDRITIMPDQDVHRTLKSATGAQFTEKRLTKWQKGATVETHGVPLLKDDYAPHADKVADAVGKVMSSVTPASTAPQRPMLRATAKARSRRAAMLAVAIESGRVPAKAKAAKVDFHADTRQTPPPPSNDRVVTSRTRGGIDGRPPVNPDAFRRALNGAYGFAFHCDTAAKTFKYEILRTKADAVRARGKPTKPRQRLGWGFDDIGDSIKDAAEDAYNGAKSVVVTVGETIEVAIHKAIDGIESVVHTVVDSLKKAIEVVANFFKQLGLLIMFVIEFLRGLFDWLAIIEAHRILRDVINVSTSLAVKRLRDPGWFGAALAPIKGLAGTHKFAAGESMGARSAHARAADSPAVRESNGVHAKTVIQKSQEQPPGSINYSGGPPPALVGGSGGGFTSLVTTLPAMAGDLLDLSPGDLFHRLLGVIEGTMESMVDRLVAGMAATGGLIADAIEWMMRALNADIDIPFVSQLYEWITGDSLTVLDLCCLGMAVPVHIVYLVVTAIMGRPRTFASENHGLADHLSAVGGLAVPPRAQAVHAHANAHPHANAALDGAAPNASPAIGAPARDVPSMSQTSELLIVITRSINVGLGVASDAIFTRFLAADASASLIASRGVVKIFKSITGIMANTLLTFITGPAFGRRLSAAAHEDDKPISKVQYGIYALLLAADSLTLLGGGKAACFPDDIGGSDQGEFGLSVLVGTGLVGLICYRLIELGVESINLELSDAPENVIKEYQLFASRDCLSMLAGIFWFMFTKTGANYLLSTGSAGGVRALYWAVTGLRGTAQAGSVACHATSVFAYAN